ncbi:MAG TPA: zinc-finger domain-containing protein [Thiobacillaceae bacterium]|nr:zinc-finger domain-containing protein [Thiobacillaceae bacterium]
MAEPNSGMHTQRVVELTSSDLPLHCPLPQDTSWNAHPRVYLAIEKTGEALCPYCGTYYKLVGGLARDHQGH